MATTTVNYKRYDLILTYVTLFSMIIMSIEGIKSKLIQVNTQIHYHRTSTTFGPRTERRSKFIILYDNSMSVFSRSVFYPIT